MYHNRVERYNKDDGVVAYPGPPTIRPQALDILNFVTKRGHYPRLGETAEAMDGANCARFGFILRYMPEKQEITGIIYEPWHFRGAGGRVHHENRLSLEEFDQSVQAAIADYEAKGGNMPISRQLMPCPRPLLSESDEAGDGEVSFYPSNP